MWKSFDSFVNFLSGLGVPGRDKRTGASFQFVPLNDLELETLYRDSWIAGKIIDCPADDATREWRSWQARPNQIENIEALEKSFDVRRKMRDALILARLFGGSVIIMGVDGQGDPTQPLDVERVKKGSLKFLHVAAPKALGTGPIITDVMDPFYGYPEYFTRNIVGQARRPPPIPAGNVLPTSSLIRGETPGSSTNVSDMFVVHPSRVILLRGKGLPDPTIWSSGGPWGDSVLQRISESINDATAIFGTSAALVNEAKVDVIKIPGLSQHIAGEEYQKKLTARFTFANVMKSTINTIILDKDEDWTRITQDFGALPEMMRMFMLIVSGAADIPATRLLGQSPAGLSATGESDIRNYYDRIASDQENDLTPTINRLDEVLIRSALGDRDPSIYYEWNPLWQTSEAEKATIGVQKANAFKIDNDAGLIDPEALRIGRQNQLIEDGTYPGLEQALEDQQLLEMESMKTPEEQQQEALQSGDPSLPPVSPEAASAASNVISLAKRKAGGASDLSPFDDGMMWDPGEHPRVSGGSGGGQFVSKGGSSKELTEEEKIALVAQMTPQQMVGEWKKQTGETRDPTEEELAAFFGLSESSSSTSESESGGEAGAGSGPADDESDEDFRKRQLIEHGLSKDEANALYDYQSESSINDILRTGRELSSAEKRQKIVLDGVVFDHKVSKSMTVYRGVMKKDLYAGLKEGAEVSQPGYLSTSTDEDVAAEIAGDTGALMEIQVKKGHYGFEAPANVLGTDQAEVMFARNSRLIYKGRSSDGKFRFDLT